MMKIDVQNFFLSLKTHLIILVLLISSFVSCKKPEVVLAEINIISPYENSNWQYADSVFYKVSLSSSSKNILKECKISIVNEKMQLVSVVNLHSLKQKAENIEGFIEIDNKYVKTGFYYLFAQVWDNAANYSSNYVKIYIGELELQSLAVIVVSEVSDKIIEIHKIDSISTQISSVYTDYSGSAISSEHALLFICGKNTGPLAAYSLHDNSLKWKVDAIQNPPFAYYENIYFDGKELMVGLTERIVKAYSPNGTLSSVFQIAEMIPKHFLLHIDKKQNRQYLLVNALYYLGNKSSINVFYKESYHKMQHLVIDWECVEMLSKTDDEIYIFGNKNNNGFIKAYSITDNNTYDVKQLSNGEIFDVAEIQKGVYLISHKSGLFMYNSEYNSLTPYGSFEGGGKLEYDVSMKVCYYAINKKLYSFTIFGQQNINQIQFQHPIKNIHILYNK